MTNITVWLGQSRKALASSHQRWLKGPINPLTKAKCGDNVVNIVMHIFKFLQMK